MDTLKTAVVVVLLLAVLYGVYVVLNKPEPYPRDLAWEAGAADPALQIELGVPEVGSADASSDSSPSPTSEWSRNAIARSQAVAPHAGHSAEAANAAEPQLAIESSVSDLPSLPIPAAATPAAPAIAVPELLGDADTPDMVAGEQTDRDRGDEPESASETAPAPTAPTAPIASNDIREPSHYTNEIESPTNRTGSSNRFSEYTPLRDEAAQSAPQDDLAAPATSTRANVNDIAESEPADGDTAGFQSVMQSVHTKIEAEAWKDALLKLSGHYNDPNLDAEQFSQLVDLLDPLAGKVIYSTEHLIEPPYQSQPGDTLKNIADRYEVPWQLLANINGIENPETLLAGRELKVVRGPFRAEVSLSKNELTLFVGNLYAGRFSIMVGNDPAPQPGQYQINDKQPGRTYYAGNGQTIPIDDPSNPYGRVWLDLGNDLSIHGSSPNGASPGQGCIALTARDAGDIYGILSKGSSIEIVR